MGLAMKSPTPAEVRAARDRAGLTQEQAGALIGVSRVTWARFEMEKHDSAPSPAEWELFLHKAGLTKLPYKRHA